MADDSASKPKADEEDLGENDTDEDDEQDFDEEDEVAEPPFLKGKVEVNDGRVFWSGRWAMSKDDHARGECQKFKYGGPQVANTGDGALILANGKYNGYFMLKKEEGEKEKVKEKGILFSFEHQSGTAYKVRATGENQFGPFTMAGEYDSSSRTMECTKQYAAGEDDADDDILDADAEPPDADEAADLKADAELSIEELKAKYYGGGAAADDGPATKKRKVEDGDDEYDEF